jgi:hypothetical protein
MKPTFNVKPIRPKRPHAKQEAAVAEALGLHDVRIDGSSGSGMRGRTLVVFAVPGPVVLAEHDLTPLEKMLQGRLL